MIKYYTAFIFHEDNPVHCTHKYLGQQSEDDLQGILDEIDEYFGSAQREMPFIQFNVRKWFGKGKNTPVLAPSSDEDWYPKLHMGLREKLDRYRPDDYGSYKPHVTTGAKEVFEEFGYYALMSGTTVLKTWPLTLSSVG